MKSLLTCLFLSFAPLCLGGIEDGLIRLDMVPSSSKRPLCAHVFRQADGEINRALVGSDRSLLKAAGKKPVRLAFAADWDQDGVDELVLVCEKLKRRKPSTTEFRFYRAPIEVNGSTGPVLAKTKEREISFSAADRLLSAAAIRHGNVDELALLFDDGPTQRLEFRPMPAAGERRLAEPLQVVDTGDPAALGRAVLVGSIFLDSLYQEALLLLREAATGGYSLEITAFPAAGQPLLAAPVASYLIPAGELTVRQVASFQVNGETAQQLLLLADDASGDESVRLYPLPAGTDIPLPPPSHAVTNYPGLASLSAFAVQRNETSGDVSPPVLAGYYTTYVSILIGAPRPYLIQIPVSGTSQIFYSGGTYYLRFPGLETTPLSVWFNGTTYTIFGQTTSVTLTSPEFGGGTVPFTLSFAGILTQAPSSPLAFYLSVVNTSLSVPGTGGVWQVCGMYLTK